MKLISNISIKYVHRLLLFVLIINMVFIYHNHVGFGSDTIIVCSLGYTSIGWETINGEETIQSKLLEKGYGLDSISTCELGLTGKKIDTLNRYFPYDNFKIKFEIDTIVKSINCDKKYCPILKVTNWEWINKYLDLLNMLSAFLILTYFGGVGVNRSVKYFR